MRAGVIGASSRRGALKALARASPSASGGSYPGPGSIRISDTGTSAPQVPAASVVECTKVFLKEQDPYTPLYEALGVLRGESVTPEEVAAAVADTIGLPEPPLRVPVGAPATRALRARRQAPENEPYLIAKIDWQVPARLCLVWTNFFSGLDQFCP